MPIFTIRLSRRESARIARLAKERKVTRSKLVRDALAAIGDSGKQTAADGWRDTQGIIKSGLTDLATNPKHLKGFGRWRK